MQSLRTILFACLIPYSASADTPQLLCQTQFDAKVLAEAVNYYVDKGEMESTRELTALADPGWDHRSGFDINERIGWLARILYVARGKDKLLRPPMFGGLMLPYQSMPPMDWPLYPVVMEEDVYLVLCEGYMLAGRAELAADYLNYCKQHGRFRRERIAVPTKRQVHDAANALQQSRRWQQIKWQDSGHGWSYMHKPSTVVAFLLSQSEYSGSPPDG
jgi:hypothetical protein